MQELKYLFPDLGGDAYLNGERAARGYRCDCNGTDMHGEFCEKVVVVAGAMSVVAIPLMTVFSLISAQMLLKLK